MAFLTLFKSDFTVDPRPLHAHQLLRRGRTKGRPWTQNNQLIRGKLLAGDFNRARIIISGAHLLTKGLLKEGLSVVPVGLPNGPAPIDQWHLRNGQQ